MATFFPAPIVYLKDDVLFIEWRRHEPHVVMRLDKNGLILGTVDPANVWSDGQRMIDPIKSLDQLIEALGVQFLEQVNHQGNDA